MRIRFGSIKKMMMKNLSKINYRYMKALVLLNTCPWSSKETSAFPFTGMMNSLNHKKSPIKINLMGLVF